LSFKRDHEVELVVLDALGLLPNPLTSSIRNEEQKINDIPNNPDGSPSFQIPYQELLGQKYIDAAFAARYQHRGC